MVELIWSKLKLSETIGLAIILGLFLHIGYQGLVIAKKERQLIRQNAQHIKTLNDSLQSNKARTIKNINTGKTTTKKATVKNKIIDNTLQDGKKHIDNSDYTINKLDSLLASYGN